MKRFTAVLAVVAGLTAACNREPGQQILAARTDPGPVQDSQEFQLPVGATTTTFANIPRDWPPTRPPPPGSAARSSCSCTAACIPQRR